MILNLSLAIIESSLPKLNKLSSELFCLRITPELFCFESYDLKFQKVQTHFKQFNLRLNLSKIQLQEIMLEQAGSHLDYDCGGWRRSRVNGRSENAGGGPGGVVMCWA